MTDTNPHIAIVEEEFLIAVDAEYLIREKMACRTTLARPDQLARWTDRELSGLDLCLMDVPMRAERVLAIAQRLRALGKPLLFTSVSELHRHGIETFEGVPVIMKPYDGEHLLAVIAAMLSATSERQN